MDDAEPTRAADVDAAAKAPESTDDDTSLIATSAVEKPELAWSAADTADVELPHRRSWKLPVALAAGALAAAGAAVAFQMWPRHAPQSTVRTYSAPTAVAPPPAPSATPAPAPNPSSPAPSPALAPLPTDSRGLPMLPDNPTPEQQQEAIVGIFDHFGIPYANPQAAAVDAQSVCAYLESGHRHASDLILWMRQTHPNLRDVQPAQFVGASMGTYCRQYGYLMNQPNGSDEATS
jgi:hypothetical protein